GEVSTPVEHDLDDNGNPVTAPRHVRTRYSYDALNRQSLVVEAVGIDVERTTGSLYDAADNVTSAVRQRLYAITPSAGAFDPAWVFTSYTYDALNRRIGVIEAAGTVLQRTTTMPYEAANNLREVTKQRYYDLLPPKPIPSPP